MANSMEFGIRQINHLFGPFWADDDTLINNLISAQGSHWQHFLAAEGIESQEDKPGLRREYGLIAENADAWKEIQSEYKAKTAFTRSMFQ